MSTPSKKLNQFLYASRKAVARTDAEIEAERALEADREPSPETQAALAESLRALAAAGGKRRI